MRHWVWLRVNTKEVSIIFIVLNRIVVSYFYIYFLKCHIIRIFYSKTLRLYKLTSFYLTYSEINFNSESSQTKNISALVLPQICTTWESNLIPFPHNLNVRVFSIKSNEISCHSFPLLSRVIFVVVFL